MELNKIHNEDCLLGMKRIPDNSINMILTDPPYGMSFRSNHRKNKYENIKNDKDLSWLPVFAEECYRVSKDNSAHYIFCSFHHIDKFKQEFEKHFKVKNILTWVKNNTSMGDLKGDFAPKTEFILFLHKGRSLIRGKRDSNVLEYRRTGNKIHPTQKPLDLTEFLITKFSDPGDIVLDPFIGSGTTAVACINTDRNYIGFELDKTYYEQSLERIKDHTIKHKECSNGSNY